MEHLATTWKNQSFSNNKRKNLMLYSLRFETYSFASYMHPYQVFKLFGYGL
jgi:hypothetical protein